MTVGFGLSNDMFSTQRINFHAFEGNKNGSPKEHKFRVLPAYAPGKLFHKVGLHWGFRTADNKMKALTCTLEDNGSCPICDKVNMLKGQLETIEAALTTEFDPQKRANLESQKEDINGYVGDHRRKPMYLWNIITEEGDQKVLQLSWNGHDPLLEKIKFVYSNQKIDVTNLQSSTLMYCNRSGLMAKTRYGYEILGGYEKALDVTALTDLSKVYVAKDLQYLQVVVDTEVIPADTEDPNARTVEAKQELPGQVPPANVQTVAPQAAVIPQTQVAPVTTQPAPAETVVTNVAPSQPVTTQPVVTVPVTPAPVTPAPVTPAPVAEQTVELNAQQADDVAEMMAALNS